jgi:nitrite reductase/ring-hydroxylating ferredoxin subunit
MPDGNITIGTVPFEVTDPQRIPSKRYYDEDFYRLENERLWPHAWQMACRLEQIPEVGDWTEYSNLGKSVIIVRTKSGVKAFHNACRHRGVQLVAGHGNCTGKGFICPFHGWRWNMDGKNTFVYGRHMFDEALLTEGELALRTCHVETAIGCAFINFDDAAPSLRDCIGPVLDRIEKYSADKLRAEWWYGTILPANWKTAMEAFMEGYHVMRTHPQLHTAAGAIYNAMYGQDTGGIAQPVNPNASVKDNILAQFKHMELLSEGMAGMCHAKDVESARGLLDVDLPDDPGAAVMQWYGMVGQKVFEDGRARGEATPDLNTLAMTDRINAVEFLFPHYFLLPFLSSMASYRIRPLGPESCIFELWSLTLFPEGQEPQAPLEPIMLPYNSDQFPPIPRQDYANIPIQQVGLHAEGFEFMRLSKDIEGLISNFHRVLDGYLRRDDPQKVAHACTMLGGNFDGPIKDLGL